MNPLVSIIIPAYNTATSLEECVKTVLLQSYKKIEIIIINDGSTDETALVCKKLRATDNRVTIVDQQNSGVSAARNAGIKLARGDFIMFVDSDDALGVFGIETLVNIAQKSSADIICGGVKPVKNFPDESDLSNKDNSASSYRVLPSERAVENLLYEKEIQNAPFPKLYRNKIARLISFPTDISIAEDLYYNFMAIKEANQIAITNENIYFYINNPNGAMKSEFSEKKMDGVIALKRLLNKNHDRSIIQALRVRLFKEAIYVLIRIGKRKNEFSSEYRTCLSLIKKFRRETLLNASALPSTRVYALLAVITPAYSGIIIDKIIRFKDRIKR